MSCSTSDQHIIHKSYAHYSSIIKSWTLASNVIFKWKGGRSATLLFIFSTKTKWGSWVWSLICKKYQGRTKLFIDHLWLKGQMQLKVSFMTQTHSLFYNTPDNETMAKTMRVTDYNLLTCTSTTSTQRTSQSLMTYKTKERKINLSPKFWTFIVS